jgi:ABC-type lipoprotein release transport system permease subunit
MLAQIAWRNLWRNTRRTTLTLAAITGSLVGLMAFNGLTAAMNDRVIEGFTGSFLGHIQVHREGWREQQQLYLTIPEVDRVVAAARSLDGVEAASARIFGLAHASLVRGESEQIRAGQGLEIASPVVLLLGIEPEHESQVTDLADRLTEGRWLGQGAEVVLGQGVAERHGARVGDAFLPTAMDQYGVLRGPWAVSDEVPRVVGIVRTGVEQIDRRMALMPLDYVARLTASEGQAHEVAIRARDGEELGGLVTRLQVAIERSRAEVVDGAEVAASTELELRGESGASIGLRLVGLDLDRRGDAEDAHGERPIRGRLPELAEEIALSEAAARELGAARGDRVTLMVPVDCGDEVPAEQCPPSEEPFLVSGVFGAPTEVLGGRLAMLSQRVLVHNIGGLAPEAVTSLQGDEAVAVAGLIRRMSPPPDAGDEVMAWYDIAPEMAQFQTFMEVMPAFFAVLIFFAVALGVINTMLMATYERTRELGLMMALGMRPSRVVGLVLAESAMLATVGIVLGTALGLALVGWWSVNGLDLSPMTGGQPMSMNGIQLDPMMWPRIVTSDVVTSVVVVGLMTVLAGLWPAIRASRFVPTKALRQQ